MKKTELQELAAQLRATGGNPSGIDALATKVEQAASAMPDDVAPAEPKAVKAKTVKPRKKR